MSGKYTPSLENNSRLKTIMELFREAYTKKIKNDTQNENNHFEQYKDWLILEAEKFITENEDNKKNWKNSYGDRGRLRNIEKGKSKSKISNSSITSYVTTSNSFEPLSSLLSSSTINIEPESSENAQVI